MLAGMPSPERFGGMPEDPSPKEQEPAPYHRAARFADDRRAARAYAQLQESIFTADCDLSAYRLLINQVPHVAVLGAPPPPELDERLGALLAAGEPVPLPAPVLDALVTRRRQAGRMGTWVEGHYRPGRPLEPEAPSHDVIE